MLVHRHWLTLSALLLLVSAGGRTQKTGNKDYQRKWLERDWAYIISPEEEAVFKKLTDDEEKQESTRLLDEYGRTRWQASNLNRELGQLGLHSYLAKKTAPAPPGARPLSHDPREQWPCAGRRFHRPDTKMR